MRSQYLPQHNPALIGLIADLKAVRNKQSALLIALEGLECLHGGLTEAQENTRENAIHKHDEASNHLCAVGIIARPWFGWDGDDIED